MGYIALVRRVNISHLKARLSAYIQRVRDGQEVKAPGRLFFSSLSYQQRVL